MSDLKPLGEKAPLNLLPATPLRAISSVMQHGSVKYAPWNYVDNSQAQARTDEQLAALLRHVCKASDPTQSDYDDESGLHHLAHAGACVLILLQKLGIDYEPSWFVRYPALCAAWKTAECPEAKAEALAAIQAQARLDAANEPTEHVINCRYDIVHGRPATSPDWVPLDPAKTDVKVRQADTPEEENGLTDPLSIAISRLVKARLTLPQIEDLMAQARGESDGAEPSLAEMIARHKQEEVDLSDPWPAVPLTLDPVNMPRTSDPPEIRLPRPIRLPMEKIDERVRAERPLDMSLAGSIQAHNRMLTEREIEFVKKDLKLVDSGLMRERCRHYWRTENNLVLPKGYRLYFDGARRMFTVLDPDKPEIVHSLTQEEIEGPEWDVVYCEGKRCHWAGFQKELINVRYSNGRAYVCPDCGHLFKHLLPPNHFTGSDAGEIISTVEPEDADAKLYKLADCMANAALYAEKYGMGRDRMIQKMVDLLKEPRYVPQPGPQERFFRGCGDSEPINDDQGEVE